MINYKCGCRTSTAAALVEVAGRWRVLLGSVALPTLGAVAVCRPA